jgi:hypothetical protein
MVLEFYLNGCVHNNQRSLPHNLDSPRLILRVIWFSYMVHTILLVSWKFFLILVVMILPLFPWNSIILECTPHLTFPQYWLENSWIASQSPVMWLVAPLSMYQPALVLSFVSNNRVYSSLNILENSLSMASNGFSSSSSFFSTSVEAAISFLLRLSPNPFLDWVH